MTETHHTTILVVDDAPDSLRAIGKRGDRLRAADAPYFVHPGDVRRGQASQFRVLDANGAVFASWSFDTANDPDVTSDYVSGGYWTWTQTLPANAPQGLWTFEADFEGETRRHEFRVGNTTASVASLSRAKAISSGRLPADSGPFHSPSYSSPNFPVAFSASDPPGQVIIPTFEPSS